MSNLLFEVICVVVVETFTSSEAAPSLSSGKSIVHEWLFLMSDFCFDLLEITECSDTPSGLMQCRQGQRTQCSIMPNWVHLVEAATQIGGLGRYYFPEVWEGITHLEDMEWVSVQIM